ncbi:hypothetical protein H5407_19720 [Mitsuaria sp. WAJ17]|uniref:hypothetical protein n=1 Tax=Mitsuaria sp. WAJ17 TaxID=2761452 RepID=UPI0016033071|nr:hypothetical protein [Mitsuaria sp. WAJ17]MBB2487469.1 hypothetical protein [Mitsuaria sp. WAJ17]
MVLALVGIAAMNTAVADVVDIRWDTTGRFMHSQAITAGKFAEVCAKVDGVKSAKGLLEAALGQDYCWRWSNKFGDTVDLAFSVQKLP